ncbi:Protein of unknown function [Cotesia congregata]|uniref:Uncharacterized protein n=1 Tax=Cotesia congregata TaxID=51543 RepID=A0A8J2MJY5_COTCN|nr:Protein of unknown function [Cotesia congregata]
MEHKSESVEYKKYGIVLLRKRALIEGFSTKCRSEALKILVEEIASLIREEICLRRKRKEFLQNILRDYEKDPMLAVNSFSDEKGCEKGDNYASNITKTTIKGRSGCGKDQNNKKIAFETLGNSCDVVKCIPRAVK